ncbi:MAG: 4a-hydroxytetrahydrobiopterin dehydratase [Thermomicrobiales bacterium]|jgi:4a-hydroxytetrahydrobiopterin dehydratase|nr:4a-hydroxytetrahydrobiopterin dehydratase [Thermomicrobiales bacterium]
MDESESMAREPLPSAEVDRLIDRELPGWRREDRGIRKRFQRATFPAAIEFVGRIADLAEAANHHPDIDIRWRTVILYLTTHEAGGVTTLDLDLARQIDALG